MNALSRTVSRSWPTCRPPRRALLAAFADRLSGHVQQQRVGNRVAEIFKSIERPDPLLRFWLDFDQSRLAGTGVTVADEVVAAGQDFSGRDPGQANPGQVVLVDLPNDFSVVAAFVMIDSLS